MYPEISKVGMQIIKNDQAVLANIKEYAATIGHALMNSGNCSYCMFILLGISFVSIVGFTFVSTINACIFAFGLAFELLLFVTSLYYLLASRRSCIEILNGTTDSVSCNLN